MSKDDDNCCDDEEVSHNWDGNEGQFTGTPVFLSSAMVAETAIENLRIDFEGKRIAVQILKMHSIHSLITVDKLLSKTWRTQIQHLNNCKKISEVQNQFSFKAQNQLNVNYYFLIS